MLSVAELFAFVLLLSWCLLFSACPSERGKQNRVGNGEDFYIQRGGSVFGEL